MQTVSGFVTNAVILDAFFNTEDGQGEIRDQLNFAVKALGDEKEYQFTMDIGPDKKTPGVDQLKEWMRSGARVTVFCSSVRSIPFVHDTTPAKDGTVKKYARPGRKVQVGKIAAELDSFVSYQAYDIRQAGPVDLLQEADAAHGAFLVQQAEYRERSNARRIAKAADSAKQRQREAVESAKKNAS